MKYNNNTKIENKNTPKPKTQHIPLCNPKTTKNKNNSQKYSIGHNLNHYAYSMLISIHNNAMILLYKIFSWSLYSKLYEFKFCVKDYLYI